MPRKGYLWDDDIRKATAAFETAPVLERYGSWVVTLYGVECLTIPYWVEFDRVNEPDWEEHMAGKRWCDLFDFGAALASARRRFNRPKARIRFLVLRRDDYRCQLCRRSAADGALLEVDHKHPQSKGGPDDLSNLWTLCEECNRGKSDLPL